MAVDYAVKFSPKVDERFSKESQAALATNNNYDFTGAKTVSVYSIPTAAMNNYTISGANRYGTPAELSTSVQDLVVTQDRSFTFTIDKRGQKQTPGVLTASAALSRQLREVVIPEYDRYVFRKLALGAGGRSTTAATKSNAYELFLAAQEYLGNHNAPQQGRVCLCSYGFANLIKLDNAFIRYGDKAQDMLSRGVIGTVDGVRIVMVPEDRLPSTTGTGAAKCAFILTHPAACVAPKQLWEYKIHSSPPGISGDLVEGRFLYDAFVLNNKADAVYYQGPTLS